MEQGTKLTNGECNVLAQMIDAYAIEVRPGMSREEAERRREMGGRLRRATRCAYGLGRVRDQVEAVIKGFDKALETPEWIAITEAMQALARSDKTEEEKKTAEAALREEHGAAALEADRQRRWEDLMALEAVGSDGQPLRLYRIAVTDLPGWSGGEGVFGPEELRFLRHCGVVYDPADEADGKK